MTLNQNRATSLHRTLKVWLAEHDLANDGEFEIPTDPEAMDTSQGAEPIYLVLRIDGMLFDIFYKRENDHLHTEFDTIVGAHGFWYDYEDSTTLVFMVDTQA